jgi:orotidine-5'-phosphate decarboxylase
MPEILAPKDRIIFPLDVPSLEQGRELVRLLREHIGLFKVGMEVFTGVGPDVVRMIRDEGGEVFLDLKFHDIPNTVAHAVAQAARLDVRLVDVHTAGGPVMMTKAAEQLNQVCEAEGLARPRLIGITVLTSLDEQGWIATGHTGGIEESVASLARLARDNGLDGVVASPKEIKAIRQACGEDFLIVTPGVRPAGADVQDQKRIATPGKAVADGADYIVVGRPIRQAKDPAAAADAIAKEIGNAR